MIEINSNSNIVNFLDVTLNLRNNSYKPFSKFNAIPTNINVNHNHPTSIVKQIPNVINIRINRLSPSKNISNNNNNKKESYNEALYHSDYINELEYLDASKHHINRTNNRGETMEIIM